MSEQAPERAHVLVTTVSADTVEDLAAEPHAFGERLLQGKFTTGVFGGPSSGAIYSYKVRPEQTLRGGQVAGRARAAGACAVQDTAAS
jgi:hypothetical protein